MLGALDEARWLLEAPVTAKPQLNPLDVPEVDTIGFLRAALSSISSQLAVLDFEGNILLTNEGWDSFAGESGTLSARPEEGANYLELLQAVTGPERPQALQLLDAASQVIRGRRSNLEIEVSVVKDETQFFFLALFNRFDTSQGPRLTLTYRDITRTRIAEQKLRESEELFKFAVEGTGSAVWDWDVITSKVRRSRQFAKMLGLSGADDIMSNYDLLLERTHPDDVKRASRLFAELVGGPANTCVMELRVRHEDGSWRWVMTRCAVIKRDAAGRAMRVLGVHIDISDLKEAEASLRNQRNQNRMLAMVAEHTTNSVLITDAQGLVVWANRSFTQVTGFSLEDIMGRKPGHLLQGPETDPLVVAEIRAQLAKVQPVRARILNYRKDGQPFWINLEIQPVITIDGTLESFVALIEDLTERERFEAELRLSQKLESVGQLAAGIAHEINTPIQFVGDSVTFLEEAWRDVESLLKNTRALEAETASSGPDVHFLIDHFPSAIARAHDGVQRVASIVRAMKEFAHPDLGEYSSADINHAIENALVVSRNEIKYVGTASAVLQEVPPVPCRIGLINQVLLNLMVNAAHALADKDHTPETGRIEVKTRIQDAHLVISISDNGCGIPESIRERIFDPFFTTKEVGRGTGQGLAIARSIVVDQHGGKITVDSTPGNGSCFEVWLPLTQNVSSPTTRA